MKSTLKLMPSPLERHLWSISLQVSAQENTKQLKDGTRYRFQVSFISAPAFRFMKSGLDKALKEIALLLKILFIFTLL